MKSKRNIRSLSVIDQLALLTDARSRQLLFLQLILTAHTWTEIAKIDVREDRLNTEKGITNSIIETFTALISQAHHS